METNIINQFLTQYKLWVLDGAPMQQFYQDQQYYFSTTVGLCGNLTRFANKVFEDVEDYHLLVDDALAELSEIFQADGLDAKYPFGMDEYLNDHNNKSFHLNPARLAWVDRQLGVV